METLAVLTCFILLLLARHKCSSLHQEGLLGRMTERHHTLSRAQLSPDLFRAAGEIVTALRTNAATTGNDYGEKHLTLGALAPIIKASKRKQNSKAALDLMMSDVESALDFLHDNRMSGQAQDYPDKRLQRHLKGPRQHNFVRIGKRYIAFSGDQNRNGDITDAPKADYADWKPRDIERRRSDEYRPWFLPEWKTGGGHWSQNQNSWKGFDNRWSQMNNLQRTSRSSRWRSRRGHNFVRIGRSTRDDKEDTLN